MKMSLLLEMHTAKFPICGFYVVSTPACLNISWKSVVKQTNSTLKLSDIHYYCDVRILRMTTLRSYQYLKEDGICVAEVAYYETS